MLPKCYCKKYRCKTIFTLEARRAVCCSSNREETLEFPVGGDYVDQEGALIEVEVWDYHWVNAPSALTWISSPGSVPWCAPSASYSGSPEVWDYHWVNAPSALTWISSPGSVPWCAPALVSTQPSQTLLQP